MVYKKLSGPLLDGESLVRLPCSVEAMYASGLSERLQYTGRFGYEHSPSIPIVQGKIYLLYIFTKALMAIPVLEHNLSAKPSASGMSVTR